MRTIVAMLVSGLTLLFAHPAQAQTQTLTFNELSPLDIPILGTVVCGNTSGFRLVSDHFHLIGGSITDTFSVNGTSYIGYESGRGFPILLERIGGGTFSLRSVDAAEFYSPANDDRPDAETLTITGFQAGGGVLTHSVVIDGIRDGVGGVPDFEHFVLPAGFDNLTSVMFTGLRSGDAQGGIAIDNIEYELAVPEALAPCVATPLAPDLPTIAISSPLAGNVSGIVVVDAVATDNLGVVSVEFKIDDVSVGAPDLTPPYQFSWDTTTVTEGPHTIAAEVLDTSGNRVNTSVIVTVRNESSPNSSPHYLDFDGVNDFVQVADADDLSFGTGTADQGLTFEMWLRPDAMVRHQLLNKLESGRSEYRLHISSNVIRLDLIDQSSNATVSVFTNNQAALIGAWHHLAVTYDGRGGATAANGVTMYIDGVAVAVNRMNHAAYVAMENLAAPLLIGREGPNWKQFDGGLDELRLWNVARTQPEIQAAMSTELNGTEAGLVAYWKFNEGNGVTAADDSQANHAGTLINEPTWVAGGPMGSAAPDETAAPVITNVVMSNLTSSSVTVTFTTSETATGWVSYTSTVVCPCTDVYSAGTGTNHVVTLTGLAVDTPYEFVVKASDAASNLATSATMSFRTLAPPPDTTAPTVVWGSPSGMVAGTVNLSATAVDDVGVVQVQFKVDGVDVGAADATPPYAVAWNTTALADGLHTLTAEARDAANNVGTASVVVNVANNVAPPHYLDFDGVNDFVQVADADDLSFGTGTADQGLTFEMWLRPDAMVRHQLLNKLESGRSEYRLHISSNVIRLDLIDQSSNATVSVFTNNQAALIGAWHHLAVTYDGRGGATAANGVTIYIDGVAVAVNRMNHAAYVAMENLAAPLLIGREGPNWKQFDGGLDELRLWNVARTQAEIQAAMAGELNGTEAGLVAYWKFNEGNGVTAADDSQANHAGTLINEPTWVAGGPMGSAAPDETAPVITNVVMSNLTSSSITVTFTTNETATGWVSYTPTVVCPCTDVYSAGTGTNHVVTLTGLAVDTPYEFVVKASDAATNLATSATMSFRTLAPPPDTTAPTVGWGSPSGTVVGTVNLSATAVDDVGVVQVQFKVDGVDVGAADATPPYAVAWNTTALADGLHTLTAEARDAANNIGSVSVIVNVANNVAPSPPHYLDFDGVDDFAQVADAPDLSFGNGTVDQPLTFEMWLRPDAMVRHQLLNKAESGRNEYRLHISSNVIRLDLIDQSSNATVSVFTNNQAALIGAWHHLAVTYDGRGGATAANGVTMYIDGVAVAVNRMNHAAYVAMENLAAPLLIGREGPNWKQFDGGLDELRLWNVARTQAEIQAAMAGELSGAEAGLVAYWKFNEGSGVTAADDSAADHTATLINGATWVAGGPF